MKGAAAAMLPRYLHTELIACTTALFARAGLDAPIAAAVADILVEADLLGYDTHGLQFVPAYLAAVEGGRLATSGEPELVKDGGGTLLIQGGNLPGQWVMLRVLELAAHRVAQQGVVTAVIRGTGNISCLATYARRAALAGHLALLMASSPGVAMVAPHGGREARYSTNPLAVGIPSAGHPILIDTSSSASSGRQVERRRRTGEPLPLPALVTAEGQPSADPETLFSDPPGAILPGGGVDYGHKGFALGLMIEALTSGLLGWGRADLAEGGSAPGNHVYLQLIDPGAFGGLEALQRESGYLAAACRSSAPMADGPPVRVPGDRAQAAYERQLAGGVALHPEILPRMAPLLEKYGIPLPEAIG